MNRSFKSKDSTVIRFAIKHNNIKYIGLSLNLLYDIKL